MTTLRKHSGQHWKKSGADLSPIDLTAEVGIGTASPSGLLHTATSTTALGQTIFEQASADSDSYDLNFRKTRGTVASPTVITTADELGVINFNGYSGAGGYVTGASIKAISEGTIATTRIPAYLSFLTGTDAAPTVLTERLRIDSQSKITQTSLLNQATGNEAAFTLNYTTNKATSGIDKGLLINWTDTLSPATVSYPFDVQKGGVSILCVDGTNSRVGIGTATPTSPLHVLGGTYDIPAILVQNSDGNSNLRISGSQHGRFEVIDTGAPTGYQAYQLISDGGAFEFRRANDGVTAILATPFTIKSDNVGIGTTSPTSRIHGVTTLQAATGDEVAFALDYTTNKATSGTDYGLKINWTDTLSPATVSYPFDVQKGGTSILCVDGTNSRVGIGTTSPGAKLEVSNAGEEALLKVGKGNLGYDPASLGYGAIQAGGDTGGIFYMMTAAGNGGQFFYDSSGLTFSNLTNTTPSRLVFQSGNAPGSGNGDLEISTSHNVLINNGNVGIGTTSPDQLLHAEKTSALTATVQPVARFTHITSGTPANGIGVGIEFEQETSASNNEVIATIEAVVTDVTATSEDADLVFKTMTAGATADEKLRVTSLGSITVPTTITPPGTTGNQTINKAAGRVNIAAAGTTVTVTNSLVTANSIVLAVAATADATAQVINVVPGAGSFVINTVAVTAETAFNFFVIS